MYPFFCLVFYAYATDISASAEVSVAHAATGDLASETNTFNYPVTLIFSFADYFSLWSWGER